MNIMRTADLKKGISVVLLAYKEAENLRVLLPKIKNALAETKEPYEILVIDTEKTLDQTPDVCREMGAKYINQEEPAFGGAFRTGIKYASMDKFLILDSDGSHDPQYIPAINRKFQSENCDVVIGSRYCEGGKTHDAWSSILMSRTLNLIFRICLGIKANDISTDYRMYDTAQLKAVTLKNRNYDVLQEVLLMLKLKNPALKIGETPISFEKRMFGESKRRLLPFIIDYLKTLIRLTCIRFSWLKNLFLYAIIGLCGAAADYGIFALLVHGNICTPELANIISGVCGFFITFIGNTFWNFRKTEHLLWRFLSYGGIVLFGMLLSTTAIYFGKELMNLYILKALLLFVVIPLIQFILNKTITYR